MKVEESCIHLLIEERKHRESGFKAKERLENAGVNVSIKKTEKAVDIDYFNYDLICIEAPSYEWQPPKPVTDLLKSHLDKHCKEER